MIYLGGKARCGKAIAAIVAPNGRPYVEPFCGALGVMRHIGYGVAADSDPEMIAMWKATQSGWCPPSKVSREEYYAIKADAFAPPELRAFVKHGCSFCGKAWGGYTGERVQPSGKVGSLPYGSFLSVCKTIKRVRNVEFVCADYRALTIPDGAVVYCDPPYSGTTAMKGGPFDSAEFWAWAELLSRRCDVFVSEYQAPSGWSELWSKGDFAGMTQVNGLKTRSVERLFVYAKG